MGGSIIASTLTLMPVNMRDRHFATKLFSCGVLLLSTLVSLQKRDVFFMASSRYVNKATNNVLKIKKQFYSFQTYVFS
jgi:hypothetical protein